MKNKGATSEVFKLALAIIIVGSILGLMAVFLSDVRSSGTEAINSTTTALEEFSNKIANKTANF